MRIQHSLKALGSALALLTAVSVASAQSDPSGQRWVNAYGESVDLNAPPPDYSPYAPPSAPPGYGPAPGSSQVPTLAPPGVPQSMAPWPAISPFQNPQIAIDQHVQQDGLWFREAIYRDRDWEASVEYIYSQYREPHGARIGSRMGKISNTQTDAGVMPLQGPPRRVYGQAVQSPLNEIVVGPGAYPFPGLLVGTNIVFIEQGDVFPVRETDAMQGGLNANGVRVRTGYMDEDGTGWMMSGFYSAETDISFRRGQRRIGGTEIDQVIIAANPLLIYTRNGAVPLVDARDWQDSAIGFPTFNGTTQKYDILFHQDFNTTSAGADLNHYLAQLYRSKNIQVSSFIGGRYFYLGEHFRFMGVDSGFGYDVSIDEDDATFGPEGALTLAYPLLESRLLSHVESHMAGPQIGLRVDIGKKKNLHIWTQSIFGLLANYEQLTVSGNNIGDPLLHPEMFDQVSFTYFDNSFKEKKTHTHVSPMLEQSFFADIRLPHLIPVLSKSFLTENASLRLGYTWTYIGAVSRPTHSISWKGFPLTPGVKIDRQDFDMNTLSVGITCPF